MAVHQLHLATSYRRPCATIAMTCIAIAFGYMPLAARQYGQTNSAEPKAQSDSSGKSPASPSAGASSSASQQAPALGPPTLPVEQIIQKFAAQEAEFKTERDNFTYTQTFTIQTLDSSRRPDGEYTMTSEIVFTPSGKRYEKVTYAPTPTLERIQLSQQDLDDLEHVQPFVLTTSELPKYNIKYLDHVQLDELTAYVFEVSQKTIEKNQR